MLSRVAKSFSFVQYLKPTCRKKFEIFTINFNDDTAEKTGEPQKEIHSEKGFRLRIPRRYDIVFIGLLSYIVLNCQRLNLSIALLAMSNSSQLMKHGNESTFEGFRTSSLDLSRETAKKGNFNWDTDAQSYIIGASFVGFMLAQTPGGRFSEMFGAKQMLTLSLFVASVCNLLSPWAARVDVYMLMGVQTIKGFAQGFIQPSVSTLTVRWFPKCERCFLTSVTFCGFPGGALIGGFVSGILCDGNFMGGWPSVFYVFGILGIAATVLIQLCVANSPEEDSRVSDAEKKFIFNEQELIYSEIKSKFPWKSAIFSVPTLALLVGLLGQYWFTFYFLSIHPMYLSQVLHLSIKQNGLISSMPYISQIIVTWIASYVSDYVVKKEHVNTDTARKFCNSLGCIGFSFGLLGVAYAERDKVLSLVCFIIAMTSVGLGFPGCSTVPLDMSPEFSGTLMGLSSTVASTSGFILPLVVGGLINETPAIEQWKKVLYISAGVGLGSGIIFHLFGSAKHQDWARTKSAKEEASFNKEVYIEDTELEKKNGKPFPLEFTARSGL